MEHRYIFMNDLCAFSIIKLVLLAHFDTTNESSLLLVLQNKLADTTFQNCWIDSQLIFYYVMNMGKLLF